MEKGFEGKLVVQAFVLFYPNLLKHVVRHQVEAWPGILDCTRASVKDMGRIVGAVVYGFAHLCARGAEPGYDGHFGISQEELRGGQVRVRQKWFVGHRLCPR